MSFDIPPHIEPMIQQYASEQHITKSEAIIRLIQEGFTASHHDSASEEYDHLLTPTRLAHLDAIVAKLDAGEKTLSSEEVDARLAAAKAKWEAKQAS